MAVQKKQLPEPEPEKEPIFKERLFEEDEDPATFRHQLIAMSDSHGEEDHYKPFTEEEKQRFKEKVTDYSIEINDLEEEKKALTQEIGGQLKTLKTNRKELLMNLKTGSVMTKEELFNFVDPASGMIGVYDGRGFLQRTKQAKRGQGLQKTIPLMPKSDPNE